MQKILITLALSISSSLFGLYGQEGEKRKFLNKSVELSTQLDSVYYAFGVEATLLSINSWLYSTDVIEDTRDIEDPRMVDAISRSNKSNIDEYLSGVYDRLKNNEKSSESEIYNSGYDTGEHLEYKAKKLRDELFIGDSIDYNIDAIVAGIGDILTNQPRRLNEDAGLYIAEVIERREFIHLLKEKNKSFMDANAQRDDVITMPSGLQYEIEVEGGGPIPTVEDTVLMNITSSLFNGKLLGQDKEDNSAVLPFKISEASPDWQEIFLSIPLGSKWKLYAPLALEYSPICIYKIELISIE